jgi:N-ethylmaleimide reductase
MHDLMSPMQLGPLELPNRVVMAPMVRARSAPDRAPTDLVARYYVQRATAGLIVTEASSVSPMSVSRPGNSAIHTPAQVAGWRHVTEQVHTAGGRIFQQLYHTGRKADHTRLPNGTSPVAPSAIASTGKIVGVDGPVDFAVPRALETSEIAGVVAEFREAIRNARDAGMDGVEIHGANGYLIDEFLRDGTNRRTDRYGGNAANRARFLLEIVEEAIAIFGAERVGARISPHNGGDGIADSDPAATFTYVARELSQHRLAYLHVIEAVVPGTPHSPPPGTKPLLPALRASFDGPLIANAGYTRETAERAIADGLTDLVAFAALYIANPDLVERFRRNTGLNEPDRSTFYNGGEAGYTDYPSLDAAAT